MNDTMTVFQLEQSDLYISMPAWVIEVAPVVVDSAMQELHKHDIISQNPYLISNHHEHKKERD